MSRAGRSCATEERWYFPRQGAEGAGVRTNRAVCVRTRISDPVKRPYIHYIQSYIQSPPRSVNAGQVVVLRAVEREQRGRAEGLAPTDLRSSSRSGCPAVPAGSGHASPRIPGAPSHAAPDRGRDRFRRPCRDGPGGRSLVTDSRCGVLGGPAFSAGTSTWLPSTSLPTSLT
jgi:hypothetical protein